MSSGGAATGRGGVIHGHERFFKRLGLGSFPHPPFLQQICCCALMKRRSVDVLLCVLRAAAFLSSARERTQEAHQNTLLDITIDDACTAVDLSIFCVQGTRVPPVPSVCFRLVTNHTLEPEEERGT